MIKVLLFARRKPGMSREAFRHHYETRHAPLGLRMIPAMRRYARNYSIPADGEPEPDFDVMTEMWFDGWDDWNATLEMARDPEHGRPIRDDEALFFDRSSMRLIAVEERTSHIAEAAA